MRSRTKYTAAQAAAVMKLLRHRLGADDRGAKADRKELRNVYGFYISDFWPRFTDKDFQAKVESGEFKIIG